MTFDHSFDHPHTPESPFNSTSTEYITQESSPKIHSLPTPAHSTNGSVSSLGSGMPHNESLSKRKREVDDIGDRKLKKPHIAHGRICLKDIHTNVSKNYKLCHNPLSPVIPDFSKDLFALYGLESVAKSVARTNPDGSKCVKLRKTYKNHIKDHQLCGNFDSVRREIEDPGSLFSLLKTPEDKWQAERAGGEEVVNGLPLAVKNLMSKAFKMSRGTIPKSSWNSSMLGDLATPPTLSDPVRTTKTTSSRPLLHNSEVRRTVKSEGPRPKRSVKKRTYGDSSYEGYGEGYVDDDGQEADFTSGDGDGIRMKRPKKSSPSHSFQGPPARHNSYGPGMVGA